MRRPRLRWATVCAAVVAALTAGTMGGIGVAAATTSTSMATIPGSYLPANSTVTGQLQSPTMSVEVVLQPGNSAGLSTLLANQYTPGSAQYGQWLAAGQFDRDFAPPAATAASVSAYLASKGLTVQATSSPFLIRAIGSSAQIQAAFATTIDTYRNASGTNFFSNTSPASLPSSVVPSVLGVVGLTNTVRLHSSVQVPQTRHGRQPSCESPYPANVTQLEAIFAGGAYGYGAGPNCTGLTPSQTNSIYNAPRAGSRAQGAGATLAVFELSGYTESDVYTWARTFYGNRYFPRISNINVDGGPLTDADCPTGDTCVDGYGGDIEVEADVEQELSISPDISNLEVYNSPNDFTGQTELDQYTAIADQDTAESISSSWGECEPDVGQSYAEAENIIFEQMATQGQSMFSSAGDTGAFDCIRDGTESLYATHQQQVDDPASQPWVTSVGGTSLETDNPGSNPSPSYPTGVESVWNELNLCSLSQTGSTSTGAPESDDCATYGAGGGGHSIFWGRPAYQRGPGVNNADTVSGPANCSLAARGEACREVPDVSANADELTGYAEYCTGNDLNYPYPGGTYDSACYGISDPAAPHWFQIGGTSLSSPLWAAIFADRDAFQGYRSGNANYLLYALYNDNYNSYSQGSNFHDITGFHQTTNQNGFYPVTPGYDEATGIGTPNMSALITDFRGYF
ncbi:MAG: S53 family peptidase [Candidatus Dormibacteria bacterium]